jgi:three-Cys-motif partner protein
VEAKRKASLDNLELFSAADYETGAGPRFKPLAERVWTKNKASLVARYLKYFVYVTKHGTYIDLFAGRQSDKAENGWSAEQVLVMQHPQIAIRQYYLFEQDQSKIWHLQQLADQYPDWRIQVTQGDSNVQVRKLLPVGSIREKEATFCLLDQRTMECEWDTCRHVASLKEGGFKPEQFYFLAVWWLPRTIAAVSTEAGEAHCDRWWGRPDWRDLPPMRAQERAELLAERFKAELGYKYASPWPIYARARGQGGVMLHMIHATDHPEAPPLMERAYRWAVHPIEETDEQLRLELGT